MVDIGDIGDISNIIMCDIVNMGDGVYMCCMGDLDDMSYKNVMCENWSAYIIVLPITCARSYINYMNYMNL